LTKKQVNDLFPDKKTLSLLPKILMSDPMSKYYNAHPGDVFRVTEMHRNSGKNIIYLFVKYD